jgi:hypothetical protein
MQTNQIPLSGLSNIQQEILKLYAAELADSALLCS